MSLRLGTLTDVTAVIAAATATRRDQQLRIDTVIVAANATRRDKQLRIPTDPVGAAVARAIADRNRCSNTRRRVNPYRGTLAAVAVGVRMRLSQVKVLGAVNANALADCSRCNSLAIQGVNPRGG